LVGKGNGGKTVVGVGGIVVVDTFDVGAVGLTIIE